MGTLTCCQIDVEKLFEGGFSTGHGFLREPNDIMSYGALAAIAIQSNQNDQHGGQSIPFFDYGLAEGVHKTFRKLYISNLTKGLVLLDELDDEAINESVKEIVYNVEKETNVKASLDINKSEEFTTRVIEKLAAKFSITVVEAEK